MDIVMKFIYVFDETATSKLLGDRRKVCVNDKV